jgi:NAD(P)-dependent dehydrogenase (short-subunit alcohol dehydrogenase family)
MQQALITGSAKRLGKDLAQRLAKLGYFTWVHYLNSKSAAEETLQTIRNAGGKGELLQGDVSVLEDVERMAATLQENAYPLGVLIHNVGIYHSGPLETFPVKQFEETIQTNLMGSYYLTQACLPLFPPSGGNILHLGYTGLQGFLATSMNTAYTIAKSGQLILTRSYAKSLGPRNIRVNMISPGQQENSVDLPEELESHIPLGRAGTSQDICSLVEFLISERGSYITGQNIEVAGGFMMGLKTNLE